MAEAAIGERAPSRFYCHVCNVQFENASTNYTCPHCCNGFIEELDAASNRTSSGAAGAPDEEFIDITDESDDDSFHVGPAHRYPLFIDPRGGMRGPRHHRATARNVNPRHQIPFEDLIQEFVVNLGMGLNWGGATGVGGGAPAGNMVFLGNPADYAWGHEGIDAVVSQLLNQMDTSGPPPLSKEVIDALPSVDVSDAQVSAKLQCSVCWEDFRLGEKVRRLPCQHVYHEPCIRPWLELHGTCPICRQNLVTGERRDDGQNNPASLALQQLFQAVQNSSGSSSSSSGSDSSSSATSSSSSYNSNGEDNARL